MQAPQVKQVEFKDLFVQRNTFRSKAGEDQNQVSSPIQANKKRDWGQNTLQKPPGRQRENREINTENMDVNTAEVNKVDKTHKGHWQVICYLSIHNRRKYLDSTH